MAVLASMPCTYIITPVFSDVFISYIKIIPASGWAARKYSSILLFIYNVSSIQSSKHKVSLALKEAGLFLNIVEIGNRNMEMRNLKTKLEKEREISNS